MNEALEVILGDEAQTVRGRHVDDWLAGEVCLGITTKPTDHTQVAHNRLILKSQRFGELQFAQLTIPVLDPRVGSTTYYAPQLGGTVEQTAGSDEARPFSSKTEGRRYESDGDRRGNPTP